MIFQVFVASKLLWDFCFIQNCCFSRRLAFGRNSEKVITRETGLSPAQFEDLLNSLPILQAAINNPSKASDALYMYLVKVRSGKPDEDIANQFKLSSSTVARRIKAAREALTTDFVNLHLNKIRSREEMVEASTDMCRGLFCPNGDKIVLICDGTYIFINKSRNYELQKRTYSDQKKDNFIKVMMCVTANGTIVNALGPFGARENDASILKWIDENTIALDMLREGDVLILDRGFRDCVHYFENKGLSVKMPTLAQASKQKKNQLSTVDANNTRLVTSTRFIVEVRNGHIKTIYKIFDMVWGSLALPHLMLDFEICSALINRYHKTIETNMHLANDVVQRMLDRVDMENFLSKIVLKDNFNTNYLKRVELFDQFQLLPTLQTSHLFFISLGKYQIKQSESYIRQHAKSCNGTFNVFVLPDDLCQQLFPSFYNEDCQPVLLMVQINSRFRSQKYYNAFILINLFGQDEDTVLGYCCECLNGLRTVGCCSHVMSLIKYTLHDKEISDNTPNPAGFLDIYFDRFDENSNGSDLSEEENEE